MSGHDPNHCKLCSLYSVAQEILSQESTLKAKAAWLMKEKAKGDANARLELACIVLAKEFAEVLSSAQMMHVVIMNPENALDLIKKVLGRDPKPQPTPPDPRRN